MQHPLKYRQGFDAAAIVGLTPASARACVYPHAMEIPLLCEPCCGGDGVPGEIPLKLSSPSRRGVMLIVKRCGGTFQSGALLFHTPLY